MIFTHRMPISPSGLGGSRGRLPLKPVGEDVLQGTRSSGSSSAFARKKIGTAAPDILLNNLQQLDKGSEPCVTDQPSGPLSARRDPR